MIKKSDEEYVQCFLSIEQGIFASARFAKKEGFRLTDKMAVGAVKKILKEVRGISPGSFHSDGEEVTFEIIYQFLEGYLDEYEYKYTEQDMVKILKGAIESIKTRSKMHGPPDGYLKYLEEFMEETGIDIQIPDK